MVKFASSIPHESLIDVEAEVVKIQKPVESCTVSEYELNIKKLFLVTDCVKVLPFQIEDANRKPQKGSSEDAEEDQQEQKPIVTVVEEKIDEHKTR